MYQDYTFTVTFGVMVLIVVILAFRSIIFSSRIEKLEKAVTELKSKTTQKRDGNGRFAKRSV